MCKSDVAPGKFVTGDPDHQSQTRMFQKRKQKIHHEMKDVKKSDSNQGPHDQ